jgi:hypothetical protein
VIALLGACRSLSYGSLAAQDASRADRPATPDTRTSAFQSARPPAARWSSPHTPRLVGTVASAVTTM